MKRTARLFAVLLAVWMTLSCMPMTTSAADAAFTEAYPSSGFSGDLITGTVIGNETGWNGDSDVGAAAAFDGSPFTYFDPPEGGSGFCGIDAGQKYILDRVAVLPRCGYPFRFEDAMIQGSNDGVTWTTLCRSDASAEGAVNYALGSNATASSVELDLEHLEGKCAVDGDMETRWASGYSDDETITLDLGTSLPVGYICIYWEYALAADFEIYLSEDPNDLRAERVAEVKGNEERTSVFRFPEMTARYVTVHGSKRATDYGFSIWEIVVRRGEPEEGSDGVRSFLSFDSFENNTGFSMFRYYNETNHGDAAEIEFYGTRPGTVKRGDADGDGLLTQKDRLILTRWLAGWKSYGDKLASKAAADVNGDGKITGMDRLLLGRYLNQWEGYSKFFEQGAQIIAWGKCGDDLYWRLFEDGLLQIYGEGVMWDFSREYDSETGKTVLESPWASYLDDICTVEIGAACSTVGAYAFCGCKSVKGDLVIPDGVVKIGEGAFLESSFDGSLRLGKNVKTIGVWAFGGCIHLKGDLILPDSVENLGQNAFSGCTGFDGQLIIGKSLTYLPMAAFNNCNHLTGDLYIPDNIIKILDGAFASCSGFNGSLHISSNATLIGSSAFRGCSGLTGDLIIPDSVTDVGLDDSDGAFRDCIGFDGILYIGKNVKRIRSFSFMDCSGLIGELTIPDSVEMIQSFAFCDCTSFSGNVRIGKNVKTMGNRVFWNCKDINNAYFYGNIPEYAGDMVFDYRSDDFTVYRLAGASGWPAPGETWNGYKTAIFAPN